MQVERRRYQIKGRRLVPRQLAACYGAACYDNPAAGLDRRLASGSPTRHCRQRRRRSAGVNLMRPVGKPRRPARTQSGILPRVPPVDAETPIVAKIGWGRVTASISLHLGSMWALLKDGALMFAGQETDPMFVVLPLLAVAFGLLGWGLSPAVSAWWTRDRELFKSLNGLMTHIEDLETGRFWLHYPQLPDVTDQIISEDLERLHDELFHRLKALSIPRPSDVRSEEWSTLLSVVRHGTLRKARKL